MARRLILISTFVGLAASVPVLYQSNPDFFMSLFERQPPEEQPETVFVASRQAPEPSLSGRQVRIEADASGHYVASFRINGRPVDALIDTGASVVALNESTARRIGLSLPPSAFAHQVQTANGSTAAAAAMIDELQIGRITVKNVQAVVLKDKALSSTLIGVSFLQKIASWRVDGDGMILEQ